MAYIEFDEPLEGLNADESVWNDDEEGYECWMYYAPPKHYHESMDDVSENAFDGNRGHPLCGENTLYIPLSNYGPICCPIHDTE